MLDAYIYDGVRSPFGRHGGCLANIRPDDLMAQVLTVLMRRNDFQPEKLKHYLIGNCAL